MNITNENEVNQIGRMYASSTTAPHLKKALKPIHLWALAVGLVISGNYFGWSYGLDAAGPIGLAIALIPVTIFYATFILSYAELATAIPEAGGPSAYANLALGSFWGYMSGLSCLIEFVFAPPAIAIALGGYIHNIFPFITPIIATVFAFIFFIFMNYLGTKTSAVFELIVTIIALLGLIVFWILAFPHFQWINITSDSFLPHGFSGIMSAIPFAIWFYLAVEGGAMSAEEMLNPQRDIKIGFISGMLTLTIMAFLTMFLTAGITDYHLISRVDFPLPKALALAIGNEKSFGVILINAVGLFGLAASLHGIIIGYSRQTFAMSRSGYLPKVFSHLNKTFYTPTLALTIPGFIGLGVAFTGLTDTAITMSVFGSVVTYIISLISLFVLRIRKPNMPRPFRVYYPVLPVVSFTLALFCLASLIYTSFKVLPWLFLIYLAGIIYYFFYVTKNVEIENGGRYRD